MRLTKLFKHFFQYLFYLFIFVLPWQTKLILRPSGTNYTEVSLYLSQLILFIVLLIFFIYKFRHKDFSDHVPSIWYCLAGLELFIFASFFVASDQVLAFYYYLIFLEALGLFYLLREETAYKEFEESAINKSIVIYTFLLSIFFHACLGIYQFLTQSTFAYKYLGLALHNPQDLGVAVVESASGRFLRAYGGFDHPNIFGGVLAISLILVVYLLAKKKVLNSNREVAESIFLFLFYFTSLFALFFTFSRSGWIAFSGGLVILIISLFISKDRWIVGRLLVLVLFSAIFLTIIASPYQDLLKVRTELNTRLEQNSINERGAYILQAQELIKNKPFFGVGIGNYTTEIKNRDLQRQPEWAYQPVHNGFILILAETGVFSFIFFIGFLGCLILKDRREVYSWAILFALVVIMMFDHWLLSLPFGVIFLFFILSLI